MQRVLIWGFKEGEYKKGTKNQLVDKIISHYWNPFLFSEASGQSLIWWPHFCLLLPLQANSVGATTVSST